MSEVDSQSWRRHLAALREWHAASPRPVAGQSAVWKRDGDTRLGDTRKDVARQPETPSPSISGRNLSASQAQSGSRPTSRAASRLVVAAMAASRRRAKCAAASATRHRPTNQHCQRVRTEVPDCLNTDSDFFNPEVAAEDRFERYLKEMDRIAIDKSLTVKVSPRQQTDGGRLSRPRVNQDLQRAEPGALNHNFSAVERTAHIYRFQCGYRV